MFNNQPSSCFLEFSSILTSEISFYDKQKKMIKKKEKTCANIVPATKRYINVKIDKNDGSFILTTETWFSTCVAKNKFTKISLCTFPAYK
jgi:hypothetical protein